MKMANPKDKKELVRSTLFDEVTWGVATQSYINSCSNIKPEGWVTIQNEALTFAKVNNCHTLLLDNIGTSTQVNNDGCGNLLEDSDDMEEDMEVEDVEPRNWVWGITQGDESPLDMEEEDVEPHNQVWGIMQDELPSNSNLGGSMCSNSDKDNSE